ncbi:Filamentation induced by cAMP protein Fic [Lentisphaera araneosa HTCC2155]|uniref:Filamentation induced by cAMP protein Fic n=1 Tax=Lentisphaera araneosa HTCC2155 TaxID=313628 RepID=A6DG29_9BACT|nr:Fic family protein [Lentisphaera araneosa]EDM29146.1 Filamentation induced by cAMP protein Fic [Lentisphaera araneosa HTCC2155]
MFNEVDQLKSRLDALRPIPAGTLKSLHDQLVLEWTYNSNAIEGNTLTIKETKVVLEGITIGGKLMREHFEAINHKEAIMYVEDLLSSKTPFSDSCIKSIHQLVLKNIDNENAGKYRSENVIISGAEHRPPEHFDVPSQMTDLLESYNQSNHHPLEKAARLHTDFVKVHPFIDGNGRTARLLMNFELIKSSYLPVIIKAENRLQYYEALDKAHTKGDYTDFIQMTIAAEIEAIEKVLSLIA